MSTIRVDNIAPSGGGTAYGTVGVAKAIGLFDNITPATIRSNNISSFTDVGTGDFDVIFINLFNAADWSAGFMADGGAAASEAHIHTDTAAITTSGGSFWLSNNGDVLQDRAYIGIHFFGDLA